MYSACAGNAAVYVALLCSKLATVDCLYSRAKKQPFNVFSVQLLWGDTARSKSLKIALLCWRQFFFPYTENATVITRVLCRLPSLQLTASVPQFDSA